MKCCLRIIIISSFVLIVIYILINVYSYYKKTKEFLDDADLVFGLLRALGMSYNAMILSITIWKLKNAKVTQTDSGHLKMTDASVLLGLQLLMIISGLLSMLAFE